MLTRKKAAWAALIGVAAGVLALAPISGAGPVPPTTPALRLAVFPIDNLTGRSLPLMDLRADIMDCLVAQGLSLIEEEPLAAFMSRNRVRWVGGITAELGGALAAQTEANAVLLTALDLHDDGDPPRIGFTMRLVLLGGGEIRVAWGTSVSLAGNDRPGILDLGLVREMPAIKQRSIDAAAARLLAFLERGATAPADLPHRAQRRFRPRTFHKVPESPTIGREARRVAVLPFVNESTRRHAGEILANRIVAALAEAGAAEVVEPGEVRKVLIDTRLIQQDGLQYAQADLIRDLLDADLIVTGTTYELAEPQDRDGFPVVDFLSTGIDARRRQVGWVAHSRSTGLTGVHFFGLGSVQTAGRLADELIRGLLEAASR